MVPHQLVAREVEKPVQVFDVDRLDHHLKARIAIVHVGIEQDVALVVEDLPDTKDRQPVLV